MVSANKRGAIMDKRKQRILQAIIQDYIKSAEPVGSRTIARNYALGISPATVRNEMYDLEQLGFLEQPHTSSGRIPSAKGYRYYVDTMPQTQNLAATDIAKINELWNKDPGNYGDFFLNVAKLISQISHNMSLFLAPAHDTSILKYIHVLPLDDLKAVMVVITDTGALDNEPIYFGDPIKPEVLAEATIKFSNALQDTLLKDLEFDSLITIVGQIEGSKRVLVILAETLHRAISKRKLFYSVGTTELLAQPEFKTVEKVQPILSLLEEQEQLDTILSKDDEKKPIKIKIGVENENHIMRDMSLIQADFSTDMDRIGTLAVLGPTRMEYSRVIGMLNYMQQFMEMVAKKNKK